MPDLTTELGELAATLADASTQLAALAADSTPAHLASVSSIVAAMEQARLSADSRALALAAQDAAANASANAYFEAIAAVRTAITPGGALSPSAHGSLREQLRVALGLADLAELDTLMAEVQNYDDVGRNAVAAAQADVDVARSALHGAEADLVAQQAAMDGAARVLTTLAAEAAARSTLAHQQHAAVESAIAAGRHHEAVVHLQDLTASRDALNAPISLTQPGFDANETDATTVTGAATAAWTAAHDAYESALAALVDSQETLFEAELALAAAEAEAGDRKARRLIDAAQQVADRQATL